MVSERFSCTLQPIQCSNDDRHLPFILSKLRTKYIIHFFSTWRFDVSVHDISSLDAHVAQRCHHQRNPCGLIGNDTLVFNCWWRFSHVTPSNHPCLASYILHFHIRNLMTLYELMSWWCSVPLFSDVKRKSNGTHLRSDGFIPQVVAVIIVKFRGFLHHLWEFYPKLHHPLGILLCTAPFFLRDNSI